MKQTAKSNTKKNETANQSENNALSGFVVSLEQFEGPLDLLLHLVKESKLSIREIKLASITQPFLDYMYTMELLDLDKASEFLEIATALIEIKLKAMLPKVEDLFVIEAEEDTEELLKQRMEKYELFKKVSEKLKTIEDVSSFYKQSDLNSTDAKIVIKDMTLDRLLDAFSKMLHKVEMKTMQEPLRQVSKDRFTVKEKMEHIEKFSKIRKTVSFFELFDADYSKSEIINTFLALLELLRLQVINVEQNGVYEDITINYRGEQTANAVDQT